MWNPRTLGTADFTAAGASPLTEWRPQTAPEALLDPGVGRAMALVYETAANPLDPLCLRDTYLDFALHGRLGPRRRTADSMEILRSQAVVRFVKELFNFYFRDDLYGRRRSTENVILSSGSVNEELFGLPTALKYCLTYALERDWYGYSDSRGRLPTRQALSDLENEKVTGRPYDSGWISVTLGGTATIHALADFLLAGTAPAAPVLCGIPNYPPLMESIAKRAPVEMVPTRCGTHGTDLTALIAAVRPDTPLIFLQTVTNPTGTAVDERQLQRLVEKAAPQTLIVLDEAHECLGPPRRFAACRAHPQVIRVASLSKDLSVPGLKLGWLVAHPDIVAEWYEYASTSMGGPPSIFYLLLEAVARFEAWRLAGVEDPADRLSDWAEYSIAPAGIKAAYDDYRTHREWRHRILTNYRDWAMAGLLELGYDVVRPTHSINLAARFFGTDTSYRWWAKTIDATKVSVYPGILAFCFDDQWFRFTPSIGSRELSTAISRIPYNLREGGVR